MYEFAYYLHALVSVLAFSFGVLALGMAIRNFRRNHNYTRLNLRLGRWFVSFLYVQLVVGLSMYYYPWEDKGIHQLSLSGVGSAERVRFWEIEHVAVMIFALFLVQTGQIFIRLTRSPRRKYLLTFWYFGASLMLMVFTMMMAMR